MLAFDSDALVCDMAETYHVYDMWSMPLPYIATLASGLGMDSRIRLKAHGLKTTWPTVLLAMLVDGWNQDTKNPFLQLFIEKQDKGVKSDSKVFDSVEDFEAAKAAILGGQTDG